MSFTCIELGITDDPDFGCTITLSDTKNKKYAEFQILDHVIDFKEKYLLIQRSYPEARYENDYYYIESSETDVELDYRDKIVIYFLQDKLKIQWSGAEVLINLELEEKEISHLRKTIKKRFKEKVILIEQ